MARQDLHFRLRLPTDLKAEIEREAMAKCESMTAVIVSRLRGDDERLRDRFAIAALPTVIAACTGDTYQIATYPTPASYFAAKAYEVADAMMAARNGGAE